MAVDWTVHTVLVRGRLKIVDHAQAGRNIISGESAPQRALIGF